MFKRFKEEQLKGNTRFAAFHFTSRDNPYLSKEALDEITGDMTSLAYRMEIMAEDIDEVPGALWTRENIEKYRIVKAPNLERIVVAIDPSATSTGDEAGIIVAGKRSEHYFTLADNSIQGSPLTWAKAAVAAYHTYSADCIVAESNQGVEMVELTIKQADPHVPVKLVHASRGKQTRAEPIAAICEKGLDHHVGIFTQLEDEMCLWLPGDASPNRMDAKVWAYTELMSGGKVEYGENPLYD
jgi:phage terminase large subunit-like protein